MQVTAPLLLLLLGFLFPICARSENRFRRPPGPGPAGDFRDNPVYRLGDRIDLQWDTDLDAVDVLVRQKQPNGVAKPAYAKLAGKPDQEDSWGRTPRGEGGQPRTRAKKKS